MSPPRNRFVVRAIHNAGWLLGGKGVGGLFSLVYLALAARSLGVERFGLFSVILSYGQAVISLVQFQSWQTVIRYGAAHLASGHHGRLQRILAFTVALDFGAALVGAMIAAIGAMIVGPHLGWSQEEQRVASLFGFSLIFGLRGTPTGVLRLFNRFDLAAYSETVLPAMRLIGALIAWQTGATVTAFLIAWAIAELATTLAMWIAAARELNRNGVWDGDQALLRGVRRENDGLWQFAWTTNITASINLVWQQLPVLAVGWIIGAGAAGGFRIAGQISNALNKPAALLARAIYPEFAHLAVQAPHKLKNIVERSALLSALCGLAVVLLIVLFGKVILELIGGPGYAFAYPFLLLLTIAAAIDLAGFGIEPAMIALGKPGVIMTARAITGLFYALALIVLLNLLGAIGAAIACVLASFLMLAVLLGISRREMPNQNGPLVP